MWEISKQGTIIDTYYNDGITYTLREIPALWCGTWTQAQDTEGYQQTGRMIYN